VNFITHHKELPYGTFISSEVGSLLNICGAVDFLIDDNLNWAVEFLIETNSPSEHLQRFNLKGGKYSPSKFKDYLVIEFREKVLDNPLPTSSNEHYWVIYYEPDFSKFHVYFCGTKSMHTFPLSK
jgi:hypothetical protein